MPSHMNALGFPVTTEQDFRHYVFQATEFGQKIESRNGSYTLWELGNGIELWVQTNLHRRIIGMNPHFHGHTRMLIELTRHIPRYDRSILDGTFMGWVNAAPGQSWSDPFPLVFDLPDYDLHSELHLPVLASIQLAAFAYHLKGFASEDAYIDTQGKSERRAVESFIPTGISVCPSKDAVKGPPRAEASMSGRVLTWQKLTNPVTEQRFYWARVRTQGGEVDVVADPQVVQGTIVRGGIICGSFWLSGRLIETSS